MAFENSQVFSLESRKLSKTEQFESVCRIEALQDKPVKKIVCINALPKITSSEKVGDGISFSGRTSYQVVYETDQGKLASAFADVEWQNKICDISLDNFSLLPKILENTVSGFSANEIAFSSLINIEVNTISSDKVASVEGLTEDYVTDQKNYEYQKAVNIVNETFNEVAEQEIATKIDEVLYYTGDVRLKSVTAGIDTIILEGDVFVNVYTMEENTINLVSKVVEFKQEIAALSVVPNNLVDANVCLSALKVSASVSDIDQKTNLIISIEINANAVIYSKENMTVLEDAFSTKKEIIVSRECVQKVVFESEGYLIDTISGSFEVPKDIEELVMVNSAEVEITNLFSGEQGFVISGGAKVEATFINENKDNITAAGIVPFSININDNINTQNVYAKARINNAKLKSQKELEIIAEIYIEYKKYSEDYVSFISSIEEIEDKNISQAAIRVYITKENEDLFRVAKAMSITPQEILNQNPNIEGQIEEGTRLIIYSPLDINF